MRVTGWLLLFLFLHIVWPFFLMAQDNSRGTPLPPLVTRNDLPDYQAMAENAARMLPFTVPGVFIKVFPDYTGQKKQIDFGAVMASVVINLAPGAPTDPEKVKWRITIDTVEMTVREQGLRVQTSPCILIERKW